MRFLRRMGLAALGILFTAAAARADGPAFVVGGEVGGIIPFSKLTPNVATGIELGYLLPVAERRLEIFASAGWAPPRHSYTDGMYQAKVTQHELHVSLGPRYRFLDVGGPFNVSLAAGPRLYFLRSLSNGSAGDQSFIEYKEQSASFGFFAALGGEYHLGPGALFLDLDFGWAKLKHRLTGDASTANLSPTVGYRFMF
jgi:hypothetical protein